MSNNPGRPPSRALDQAAELLRHGEPVQAEAAALQASIDDPASARAWFLIGAARHAQRKLEAALAAIRKSVSLDSELQEARRACAAVLLELQRPREALTQIEELLLRRPAATDFLVDAGVVLEALGEPEAALSRYDEALRCSSGDFRARLNRGALLARLGRLQEALQDNQTLVRGHVGSAAAHYNLADVLLRLDRYSDSLAAVERALRLAPQSAEALMLRGLVLSMLGRDGEAIASFSSAHAADAEGARQYRLAAAKSVGLGDESFLTTDPHQIRLARLLERQKSCDWTERERLIVGMQEMAAALLQKIVPLDEKGLFFTSLSLPMTCAEHRALADGIAAGVAGRTSRHSAPIIQGRQHKKIRLGFLSPDFREHPAARLHWRQLAEHDRSLFEVFAYSIHPGDGSASRKRVEEACDVFREVSELAANEVAGLLRLDGIDILVDLAGYTDSSKPEILALQPAPLRVSYLGMPATLGGNLIDYRLTDAATTPPETTTCWPEKLVYLPDTFFIYNDQEEIADTRPIRDAHNLPEGGFVFCCFNSSYKIEPDVFGVWMRLLHEVSGSVLWLVDGGDALKRNLRREASLRGIDPQRILFAPRLPAADYLARYACADLFLDTFYYNAGTTAADALWAGLPVLTRTGSTMASRQGASIVRAAGLPELVAPDQAAYEATALRLARQPQELAALRERLVHNRRACPLFDTAQRVRELDRAFEMMWQRHLAGLQPESFAVPRELGTSV